MITVPGGQVTLTDRRTQHSWTVEVAPYLLAAHPLTQAAHTETTATHRQDSEHDGGRLPAHSLSWWDAVRYCNTLSQQEGLTPAYRLHDATDDGTEADGADGGITWDRTADGYRLPTEAEWEHACRAGTEGPRYGPLDDIAWHRGNSQERIHEVATRRPNSWGLYDMLGNIWEWCWDLYDPDVYGSYRVLKGGGWYDPHWSCRTSVRRRSHPTLRIEDIGLRLARTPRTHP